MSSISKSKVEFLIRSQVELCSETRKRVLGIVKNVHNLFKNGKFKNSREIRETTQRLEAIKNFAKTAREEVPRLKKSKF
jgi:hypothetical protein